jgi:arabinose-5-phosphate isomerase
VIIYTDDMGIGDLSCTSTGWIETPAIDRLASQGLVLNSYYTSAPVSSPSRVGPEASFSDLMREMSAKGLGCSAIVDAAGHIQGIFTDGDLRRRIEAGADLRTATAAQVMHPSPRRIAPDALAVDAAELMEAHGITSVLVVDAAGVLTGVVHIGDLMRAKVI